MPRNRKFKLLNLRIPPRLHNLRIHNLLSGYEAIMCGAESGPGDLDFAFGALDAYGGVGGIEPIGISSDAEIC